MNPFLSASIILKDPGSSAQMECIEETHGESLEALCTRQGFFGMDVNDVMMLDNVGYIYVYSIHVYKCVSVFVYVLYLLISPF